MKKGLKTMIKVLSVFLTVLMVLQIAPMQLIANAYTEAMAIKNMPREDVTTFANDEDFSAEILYEVEEKRDEFTKVYKKNDGSYTAMVSSEPLHFIQNGKWTDIDNTLVSSVENGKSVFKNTNSMFDIMFPDVLSENSGIEIKNDEYSLSFSLQNIEISQVEITENTNNYADTNENNQQIKEQLKTQSDSALYENVMPETDIEYSISSNKIKENIIINQPSAIKEQYSFNLSAEGLTGVIEDDNSVSFLNADGEKIFYIPAPFMKDASEITSLNIDIDLTNNGNGEYVLTYSPDSEWLNDELRTFPIIIDPIIGVANSTWIEDVSVTSENPDDNFYTDSATITANGLTYDKDTNEIVDMNVSVETYVAVDFEKIDLLTEGITPIDAQLVFAGAAMNVAAYEITSAFDPTTVTYNTKPQVDTTVIDYYTGKERFDEFELIHFNITDILYDWISGSKVNNGIAILGYDNTLPGMGIFTGVALFIEYVETSGYDDRFDHHTQDIGRAGTSYINDFTQKLTLIRDDISISGNIMPVSISFVYNSAFTTMVDKFSELYELEDGRARNIPQVYGNNWITNYNRGIFINELASELVPTISYFTETGTVINFVEEEQEDGSTIFVEEKSDIFGDSGYSLIYDSTTEFNNQNVKIKNPNGEIEEFDSNGRLVKIYKENYPSQSINIVYASNLSSDANVYAIDYITDGVGRKYDFSYDSDTGLLTKIQTFTADGEQIHAGSTAVTDLETEYYYDDNGNMTTVYFPDLPSHAKYEYDANNRVTSATSLNAYKLTYSYDACGRVRSVSEFSQDTGLLSGYVAGNTITITPDGPKQVTFSDLNGAVETKQFDRYGRTTLVTDEKGNYVNSSLGSYRTMSKNLLSNQSFENGLDGWVKGNSNPPTVSETYSHSGEKSLKFASDSATTNYVYQIFPATETGIYTFSVYVKAANEFSSDEKISILCGTLDENGDFIATDYRTIAAVTTDFNRYSVSVDIPENSTSVVAGVGFVDSYGEFYVDSAQLEKGSGFGSYNQLTNSSFTDTSENVVIGWTSNSTYTLGEETINTLQSNTVNFPASKNANYTLSQTVQIDGNEGDIVTFGGWLKAYIVANDTDRMLAQLAADTTDFSGDRFAGFTLTYSYVSTDENGQQVLKTETIKKSAKDFIEDWQFVEEYVILKGDTTEFTVSFEYTKHPSAVSTSMPFFTIESGFAETEEVETTETIEAETQASSVTTVDLCACGENCEYGDGCPCECASEEECDCAECQGCICSDCTNLECTCTCTNEESCTCDSCMKMFDIQYDEYGNLLSIKIAGKDASQYLSMFTARSFSANGNYMASSTDENGKITTYDYNETNGVLDSVTDPCSNVTEYTYDAIGALTQVSTPVSNLAKEGTLIKYTPDSLDTVYGYKDDKLTSISHNDFTYYIKYDQWGNVSKVYVGGVNALTNTTSADYSYGTGENRNRLESITYGNGDTVLYVYDDYDRVTKISYDGGATYRFVYGYDTLGNVTYVIDNSNSITTFYNENSTEVYKGESLLYYSGYDENGDLFEYEGGLYNYTTKELESTTNPLTGYTTTNTQIGDEHSQANLLKTTDKFSRTRQKTIQLRDLQNTESSVFASVITDYTYKTYGTNSEYAGGQVDTIKSYVTYGEDTSEENIIKEYGLSYRYDDNGNITHEYSIDSNNVETLRYRYTYDEANQITRVDDNIQSKTYVYQYDKGGNRVSEKIYAYTLSDSLGTVQQEIVSEYDNIVWDDLLTSYNGKEITYDNAGNPTSYDGKTFVWNGKQLKQITAADGSKTLFNYDANGLRTRKVQYDETNRLSYYVEYIWADGKIVSQYLTLIAYVTYSDGSTKSVPIGPIPSKIIYDDNGIPQGFTCGEANFGFVRNLQGDVIAMVDFEGNIVMEYSYDPWGNIEYHFNEEVTTEEEAIIYTALCPLTYRGYNYDFTTGLYYLQSRYYNPEWGRFLNCDDTSILLATQGETHNANLFAYCANNPVNRVDYTGYDSKEMSLQELDVYLTAFYSGWLILKNSDYKTLLDNEICDFRYDINEYNLVIYRFMFKKSDSILYNTIRFVAGENTSWYAYSNYEYGKYLDFNEFESDLLNNHTEQIMDTALDCQSEEEYLGWVMSTAMIISLDMIIYIAGVGVIKVSNHEKALTAIENKDDTRKNDGPCILVGFEKEKGPNFKPIALLQIQSDNMPNNFEDVEVYP